MRKRFDGSLDYRTLAFQARNLFSDSLSRFLSFASSVLAGTVTIGAAVGAEKSR
jgi:hypothetical protein